MASTDSALSLKRFDGKRFEAPECWILGLTFYAFSRYSPHSLATGFLHLVDYIALFYLVLLLWIPFYWLVFHTAIRFWRRLGNRAFWVALPVWLIFAAGVIMARHQTLRAAAGA